MHWINFPLIAVMIWSGLRIYWANDVYRIGLGDWTLFAFFPDGFNETARPRTATSPGEWRSTSRSPGCSRSTASCTSSTRGEPVSGASSLRIAARLKESAQVLLHDLHLRKESPPTNGRYNAAQRLSYSLIIVLGGVAVLTGFAIYKPTQLSFLTTILGGYETARADPLRGRPSPSSSSSSCTSSR